MMIGKYNLLLYLGSKEFQQGAKIGRVRDTGEGGDASFVKVFRLESGSPVKVFDIIRGVMCVENNGPLIVGSYPFLHFPTVTYVLYLCEDEEIGSIQVSKGFPQGSPGKEVPISESSVGVHQENVYVAFDAHVLKSIVQDGHMGVKVFRGVLS